ncbi:MAG: FadR family transcriptional regulator [Caulobacteraceae bacterium]|nr:FadR family transcriptional regulator [Caulobacteraceae bacterium]
MPVKEQTRGAKLAEKVAAAVLEDIALQGWPVGKVVATMAELTSRYGAGQATVAEASRQLERIGVAEVRRGVNGGLVVLRSPQDAVAWTVATYFELVDVSLAEQVETWTVIQGHSLILAAQRLREPDARRLRELAQELKDVSDGGEFYNKLSGLELAIVDAAQNRATSFLARVFEPYWYRRGWDKLFADLHGAEGERIARGMAEVVEALVAGDAGLAASCHPHRNGFLGKVIEERSPSFAVLPPRPQEDRKLGEATALAVRSDIVRRGLQPGDRLGQMSDLLLRFRVGVPAMREAIGLLELHHIASSKPGRGGGVVVGAPCSGYTAQTMAEFLLHTDIHPCEMFDIWRDLLVAAVDKAVRGPARDIGIALRNALQAEHAAAGYQILQATNSYYRAIASVAPNRMLSLLVDACAEFLARYPWPVPRQQIVAFTAARHEAIAEAMVVGDAPLARRRMLDFLMDVRPYFNDVTSVAEAPPSELGNRPRGPI